DVQDASFAAYGDAYHHHVQPEPPYACLSAGTCFNDNFAFIYAAQKAETAPRADVDARAEKLVADLDRIDDELAARVALVAETADDLELPSKGSGRTITLIRTGHPTEARRDAALAKLTIPLRVRELSRAQHPALVDALGKRLTAAVLIDKKLYLDVVDEEQWTELLGLPFPPPMKIDAFDAHEHIAEGGAERLRTFVVDE